MFPYHDPTERGLVRAAVGSPADPTTWLVYADWLEDHDRHERAEFLRLQVRLGALPPGDPDRPGLEARGRKLRAALHPDWVAFFDVPPVENCGWGFVFECPEKWERLTPTGDLNVRQCGVCDEPVYYCRDLGTAQHLAWGLRPVVVSLAVDRRPGDLYPPDYEPEGRRPPRRRPWWKFW